MVHDLHNLLLLIHIIKASLFIILYNKIRILKNNLLFLKIHLLKILLIQEILLYPLNQNIIFFILLNPLV